MKTLTRLILCAAALFLVQAQAGQNTLPTYIVYPGGTLIAESQSAPAVIKGSHGTLYRIIVINPGSSGTLTVNDNAATDGTNTIANTIYAAPFGSLTAGQVITLEEPYYTGLTLSSLPTGAVVTITYF